MRCPYPAGSHAKHLVPRKWHYWKTEDPLGGDLVAGKMSLGMWFWRSFGSCEQVIIGLSNAAPLPYRSSHCGDGQTLSCFSATS